jgi:hypothetical protein
VVTDPERLRAVLGDRLGTPVTHVSVGSIDYVRDSMELDVQVAAAGPASSLAAPGPDADGTWVALRRAVGAGR